MNNDLTIIIAHYLSSDNQIQNPLIKTLEEIYKQQNQFNIEVIIADDGSDYSKGIIENHSKIVDIQGDPRNVYVLEKNKLIKFLDINNFGNDIIKKWVYLPKTIKCMSKARITNYAVKEANSNKILFLDDDNYFISKNSIYNLIDLFKVYDIVIGQIKDNNGKIRKFTSNRVQGTTIGIKKNVFENVGGLGEWTEEFSCGVDSDFWIKLYNYYIKNNIKACYTNKISTYDSCSKRWGKFTTLFRNYKIKKEFFKRYKCNNYKNKKYNLSRNKKLWIENLI